MLWEEASRSGAFLCEMGAGEDRRGDPGAHTSPGDILCGTLHGDVLRRGGSGSRY